MVSSSRIGLIVLALMISLFVNRIYVARLKEIAYQISFQKINAEVSSDFIAVTKTNFDEKVLSLLQKLGEFFNVDRTYLFLINHENQTLTYSHEWCGGGIPIEVETIKNIPIETFSWWISQLEKENMVYIEDVNVMPSKAFQEQQQLLRQNIKSLVSVPIKCNVVL